MSTRYHWSAGDPAPFWGADPVAAGAERLVEHIERRTDTPQPDLRRQVEEELAWSERRGDDLHARRAAAMSLLRPILRRLGEKEARAA